MTRPTADKKVLKTDRSHITSTTRPARAASRSRPTGGMKIAIDTTGSRSTTARARTIKLPARKVSVNDGALEVT